MRQFPHTPVSLMQLLEIHADQFCRLSSVIGQSLVIFQQNGLRPDINVFAATLGELQRESERLGWKSVFQQLERIREAIKGTTMTNQIMYGLVVELYNRMTDELGSVFYLQIATENIGLYKQDKPLLGLEVEAKLPEIEEDISEAAKCLALCRNTAMAFHLMRALERCLVKLGIKLDATVVDKFGSGLEWGVILGNINGKIALLPRGDNKDQWSETATILYHVKQAWRNPTMHPKQTYTDEEAHIIFGAVGSFIRHLASLL